jgi:hypothetical protein
MYDKTTHARVVSNNYFWIGITEEQLLANMNRIWDKPNNYALSHIKAGIAQLESRGILTKEEAQNCLKETLKMRKSNTRENT